MDNGEQVTGTNARKWKSIQIIVKNILLIIIIIIIIIITGVGCFGLFFGSKIWLCYQSVGIRCMPNIEYFPPFDYSNYPKLMEVFNLNALI